MHERHLGSSQNEKQPDVDLEPVQLCHQGVAAMQSRRWGRGDLAQGVEANASWLPTDLSAREAIEEGGQEGPKRSGRDKLTSSGCHGRGGACLLIPMASLKLGGWTCTPRPFCQSFDYEENLIQAHITGGEVRSLMVSRCLSSSGKHFLVDLTLL